MRTLEAGLARLRGDAEANQKGRAREGGGCAAPPVAKPEPARAASPMLYPLVGFGALLAAADRGRGMASEEEGRSAPPAGGI